MKNFKIHYYLNCNTVPVIIEGNDARHAVENLLQWVNQLHPMSKPKTVFGLTDEGNDCYEVGLSNGHCFLVEELKN